VIGGNNMEDIKNVYPDAQYKWGFSVYGYGPMLQSFGYEILIQVDDNDYDGDSRLLLKDGNSYGILIFGWGSCSGCDALQACDSYEEVDELRNMLNNEILWRSSAENLLDYIVNKDWELEYAWHHEETRDFIDQITAYLRSL
jgi:hypothetical protein